MVLMLYGLNRKREKTIQSNPSPTDYPISVALGPSLPSSVRPGDTPVEVTFRADAASV